MLGFAINVMSGMLFFAAAPRRFTSTNPAFYWKLVFFLPAAANVLYFTFDDGWQTQTGRRGACPHQGAGGLGAVPVGGRHVLGQHAALHRQRLLGAPVERGS